MANGNPDISLVGVKIPRYRRLPITSNPTINSGQDSKPVHINRRDYDRTDGSCIGFQAGPNQTVVTTHDIIGAEIRARTNAVGSGGITAVKAEPTATSGTGTIGSVRGFETNITVNGTRTVTNDISALRAFLDVAATVTVTGKKSIIQVANENQSAWDYLLNSETGAGIHDLTSGTYTTAEGFLKVRIAGSDYQIPFFTAAD
jgi:hypothetical protein